MGSRVTTTDPDQRRRSDPQARRGSATSGFLLGRNALADGADVPSDEMIAIDGNGVPTLSIVIPTFQRPAFLAEAVKSAMAQDHGGLFEVVVIDDDPLSDGHERLRAAMPDVGAAGFRYLRNRRNLGMYPNINRCVSAARGSWLTILHDDDLLDPDFARRMFRQLAARPDLDGLVCRKRLRDHRAVPFTERGAKRAARRLLDLCRFRGRAVRRITARKLFWGCIVGNTVGFLCRTADVRNLGGFLPEEHPSSDYFFYARFAERFALAETCNVLATIRIADNSLMRPETQLACLRRGYELQQAYVGTVAPRWWRRVSPLLMAWQIANTSRVWRSDLTRAETIAAIGIETPRNRPLLLLIARAMMRGL